MESNVNVENGGITITEFAMGVNENMTIKKLKKIKIKLSKLKKNSKKGLYMNSLV